MSPEIPKTNKNFNNHSLEQDLYNQLESEENILFYDEFYES